jgi:hypothetical protein
MLHERKAHHLASPPWPKPPPPSRTIRMKGMGWVELGAGWVGSGWGGDSRGPQTPRREGIYPPMSPMDPPSGSSSPFPLDLPPGRVERVSELKVRARETLPLRGGVSNHACMHACMPLCAEKCRFNNNPARLSPQKSRGWTRGKSRRAFERAMQHRRCGIASQIPRQRRPMIHHFRGPRGAPYHEGRSA